MASLRSKAEKCNFELSQFFRPKIDSWGDCSLGTSAELN